jgi:hypothetical protein
MKQCVARYQELAGKLGKSLPHATPFIDETKDIPDDKEQGGQLQSIASKVLMKVLYAARMARYDLLRPTCMLASRVTKWNLFCDLMLHRLMCYINSTHDLKMISWVGDRSDSLTLELFADADFAGDKQTMRSTSGMFLCLSGGNTCVPLSATSKKQPCVSHSTPEAEIVSVESGLRAEGLPALTLWDMVLQREVTLKLQEDNQATIRIIESGKSPNLRHLNRTHRVNIAWLSEQFQKKQFKMSYCKSEHMRADIFTKAFTNKDRFEAALKLINHI